ncbi:MAG: hypothetical protein Kow0077_30160 [Anaerolineae bacterium]
MSDLFVYSLTEQTPTWSDDTEARVQQSPHNLELLQRELTLSGHQYTIQQSAPVVLQRFFTGEIDLDTELSRRFNGAPLLSYINLRPRNPGRSPRGTAEMISQDQGAALIVDINRITGVMELGFTLGAMLSLRFELSNLPEVDRRRWLDLMRREQGIAFLWSRARWERDYMIFIVRRYNIRAYAFSPNGYEAAVRMTPEVLTTFLDWLEGYWS